eukprot:TRINITY_DN14353_c0_g2_i2.p1 TRINITY_DN14353_c0_g2~~TRINITY_DN14353_c0_g2_i2.p1  ORF type:complete len:360 (+),score=64.00 TRINITY_DN14353_c0_g2_i2:67-1146(+)
MAPLAPLSLSPSGCSRSAPVSQQTTPSAASAARRLISWSEGNLRSTARFRASGHLPVEDQRLRRAGRNVHALVRFCHEPLPWYKTVEPVKPRWPKAHHWYNLKQPGVLRALDLETIVVPVGANVGATRKGRVTYSANERMQFELDAEALARLLREIRPSRSPSAGWSVRDLERAFREHCGRRGCWADHQMSLGVFLALFPKTFVVAGADGELVRPQRRSGNLVVDDGEEVMMRLALAKDRGFVEAETPLSGRSRAGSVCSGETEVSTELQQVRVKAKFRADPPREPARERSVSSASTALSPQSATDKRHRFRFERSDKRSPKGAVVLPPLEQSVRGARCAADSSPLYHCGSQLDIPECR